MTRISLPQVTLLCTDCVDADRAIEVIERCKTCCDFGAVKLLTSKPTPYPHVEIPQIGSLNEYSVFMVKRAHEFVETPYMLVVQWDGFILNRDAWDPGWLSLDYIGPLYQQYAIVGSGGFSLRTRKIMVRVSQMTPPWDGTPQDAERIQSRLGAYEDGVVSLTLRPVLEAEGFRYATLQQAARFAQGGNNDPAYYVERPFGFHRRWPNINLETGFVAPPPFFEKE